MEDVSNKYKKSRDKLKLLCKKASKLSCNLTGRKVTTWQEKYASRIFCKTCLTIIAILKVLPKSAISKEYRDISSVSILVRALIDNYYVFHYLIIETMKGNKFNVTEDEANFRFILWKLHGECESLEMVKRLYKDEKLINSITGKIICPLRTIKVKELCKGIEKLQNDLKKNNFYKKIKKLEKLKEVIPKDLLKRVDDAFRKISELEKIYSSRAEFEELRKKCKTLQDNLKKFKEKIKTIKISDLDKLTKLKFNFKKDEDKKFYENLFIIPKYVKLQNIILHIILLKLGNIALVVRCKDEQGKTFKESPVDLINQVENILLPRNGIFLSVEEISERAGIRPLYYSFEYKYLSNYVHTFQFSVNQLSRHTARNPESLNLLCSIVDCCELYTGFAIRDFIKVFPEQAKNISPDIQQIISKWENEVKVKIKEIPDGV